MSQQTAELKFANEKLTFEARDFESEREDLLAQISRMNESLVSSCHIEPLEISSLADSGSGTLVHQGLAMPDQTYGNLSALQLENLHLETTRLLDTQCENENLRWELSLLQMDSTHVIGQM